MPPTFTLLDLTGEARTIGRGVAFYCDYWDETTDLAMTHLGDTEGDISLALNEAFSHLTLPELTGPAKHKSYYDGEDPVASIPLYIADATKRGVVSPTGSGSGGYKRRRPVKEYTLAIFPEEMFFDATDEAYEALAYGASGWTIGGSALTAAQQALMNAQAIWLWRGYFTSPPFVYKHGDGGKNVEGTTFQVLIDTTKPDGQMIRTLGDPAASGIYINPVTS